MEDLEDFDQLEAPLEGGEGGEKPPAKAEEPDPRDAEIARWKAEAAEARSRAKEMEETARHWADRAKAAPVESKRAQREEPDEDPGKLADELVTHGAKALLSRGFLTKAEAEELARNAARAAVQEDRERQQKDAMAVAGMLKDMGIPQNSEIVVLARNHVETLMQEDPDLTEKSAVRMALKIAKQEYEMKQGQGSDNNTITSRDRAAAQGRGGTASRGVLSGGREGGSYSRNDISFFRGLEAHGLKRETFDKYKAGRGE